MERFIVRSYLYPAFESPGFSDKIEDQFAFRPTGSTTAAIIALLQNITTMLLTNDYVVVISTDLSKAFDTVRHSSLAEKLAALDIPDLAYNWLVSYYHNRGHVTSYAGVTSLVAYINVSVVQA